MRRGVTALAAVGAGVLIAVPNVGSASTAADTTPPALTLQPAGFVQGGILGPSSPQSAGDASIFTFDIPMFITWRGSDASGICGYDVHTVNAGGFDQTVLAGTRRTRYDGSASDYNGDFGGGQSVVDTWAVVARDCAGNTTRRNTGIGPQVTQEDGATPSGFGVSVTYAGTWGTSSCTCWSHGAVRRTTQKGASASITFSTRGANRPVALVMEKAPNRGKFTLVIDGVNRGTVDTFSSVATHRVIVWSGRVPRAGNHVVKIVNQATAGRPRIDFDAVLTNG